MTESNACARRAIVDGRVFGFRCGAGPAPWTAPSRAGMNGAVRSKAPPDDANRDETFLSALLHLVERPDLRHPVLDLALRRAGRARRVRQPLLPYARRQDRPF